MYNTINIIVTQPERGANPILVQYPLTEEGESEAFQHFQRLSGNIRYPEEEERAYEQGYFETKDGSKIVICESYLD